MALNSSNSNAGSNQPGIGAGALSNFNTQKTDNKSNGNFSGGDIKLDTSKLNINNPFNTNVPQQPTFDVDSVFKPNVSGNIDIDLPKTNNNTSNTTYSNNSPEPTMTVDEVYNKTPTNNQPVVEKQGDYSASSNEKSNVKSSTFGDQDEISVTPTSVTENKGMIGNSAIQSVEGLDFHQKDKASVDVLDSKKKRDEAEAEDKADNMRNKLKGGIGKAAQQEGGENFKIGTSEAENDFNKENAKRQAELDQKKKAKEDADNAVLKLTDEINASTKKYGESLNILEEAINESRAIINDFEKESKTFYTKNPLLNLSKDDPEEVAINKLKEVCEKNGIPLPEKTISAEDINDYIENYCENEKNRLSEEKKLENKNFEKEIQRVNSEADKASRDLAKAEEDYNNWKKGEEANLKAGTTPEPEPEPQTTPKSGAETLHEDAMNAIENSTDATPEQKAQAEEALTNLKESRKSLEEAAAKASSGNPADMVAYQEALETYNKNLKEAQKIGNRFTQTDFNKKFTKAVAAANDFKVTLADGTEMEYSDFATKEATKSPQYAKVMYEAKATKLEEDGHPILAKIERIKAEWSQTWLGSKLTWADNKVRNQFNQMAKTDMRATYAAYNNVLNDETGKYSEDDKAEASKAINQANALMTASAALQATTGFLSSIGDGMDDGTFGTTDPGALTDHQEILNSIDNFIKITLRLGISPAANEAYQNMYYLNKDKEQDSGLFTTDFDKDGFALCQEYGNSAAAGMIAGVGELGVGVAMLFNPATRASGIDLIKDSFDTFFNGLYGVRDEVETSQQYTQQVLDYLKEAEDISKESGNEEAVQEITNAITQIENFELKADEVGNLDNWLEGSGSNTTSNEKFNQSLSYDEWMKLIEADPVMRDYAKSLAEKKKDKDAQKDDVDTGVNS